MHLDLGLIVWKQALDHIINPIAPSGGGHDGAITVVAEACPASCLLEEPAEELVDAVSNLP